jgi:hypothetical protein
LTHAKFARLSQSSDTANFQFVDQVQQHSRGGARVARSAMTLGYLKSKIIGKGVEVMFLQIRHHAARELDGAQFGVAHPAAWEHARDFLVEQGDIKVGIVRRQHGVACEVQP